MNGYFFCCFFKRNMISYFYDRIGRNEDVSEEKNNVNLYFYVGFGICSK